MGYSICLAAHITNTIIAQAYLIEYWIKKTGLRHVFVVYNKGNFAISVHNSSAYTLKIDYIIQIMAFCFNIHAAWRYPSHTHSFVREKLQPNNGAIYHLALSSALINE